MQKLAFTLPPDQPFATAFADWVERNSGTVFITSVYDAAEALYREDKVVIEDLQPGKVTAKVTARGRGKANLTLTYAHSGVVIDCSCKYQKGPCKHTAALLWVVDDQPDERVNSIAADVQQVKKVAPAKKANRRTKKKPATPSIKAAAATTPSKDKESVAVTPPATKAEEQPQETSTTTSSNKRKQRGKRSNKRGGRRREATPELTGEDLTATTETKLKELPVKEVVVEQQPLVEATTPKTVTTAKRGTRRNQKPSAKKSRKQQTHEKPRSAPAKRESAAEGDAALAAAGSESRSFEAYLESLDRRLLVDLVLRFAPASFRDEHIGEVATGAQPPRYLAPSPTAPHPRPRPNYTEDDGSPQEAIALLNDRLSLPYEHGSDPDRSEVYQVRVGLAADYEGPKDELDWLQVYLRAIPTAETLRYAIQRRPRHKEQFRKALREADPEAYQDYLDMEATA